MGLYNEEGRDSLQRVNQGRIPRVYEPLLVCVHPNAPLAGGPVRQPYEQDPLDLLSKQREEKLHTEQALHSNERKVDIEELERVATECPRFDDHSIECIWLTSATPPLGIHRDCNTSMEPLATLVVVADDD